MYDDVTVNRAAGRMYLDKKSLFRRCVLRDSCLNAGAGFMEQMSKGGGLFQTVGLEVFLFVDGTQRAKF